MLGIIAGNYKEAKSWASGQLLAEDEWFYISDIDSLIGKVDFHVIVVGTAGDNIPPAFFERLFFFAKKKGKMKK